MIFVPTFFFFVFFGARWCIVRLFFFHVGDVFYCVVDSVLFWLGMGYVIE